MSLRNLAALVVAVSLVPAAAAGARDVTYAVFVDGRPVDRRHDSARERAGIPYIDVVRAVRTFDGLLTYRGTALDVTISGRVLHCTVGARAGVVDGTAVILPGAPFVSEGDTYVPLETIAGLAGARVRLDGRRHRVLLSLAGT